MVKWYQSGNYTLVKVDDNEVRKIEKVDNKIVIYYNNNHINTINFPSMDKAEEAFSEIVEELI